MIYYDKFKTLHFLEYRKCLECKNDIIVSEQATSEWGTAKFECLECGSKYELFMARYLFLPSKVLEYPFLTIIVEISSINCLIDFNGV